MALLKIGDFDPDYRKSFDESDIKGHGVYTQTDEKIGTVNDILVDEEGHLRYFIVDLGFWIFGKKVLLPVGRTRIDHNAQRVYAVNMTRDQADSLPEFSEDMALDYDYEERVRGVYRAPTTGTSAAATGAVAPLEASAPLDTDRVATPAYANYDRNTYSYQHEPDLYNLNEQDHQTLRLYQERLVASKRRVKTGEVAIGKHVETEVERVSVPVEKERVIVERVTPADAGRPVAPGEATFREGEVAHVEVYEETPEIRKEAFVREEVRVRKEVEQEVVNTSETVRREELDVNTGNLPVDERTDRI